eukprot:Rhum_TRINITY_DN959_c0_g1::Rhum_TRINITY_DN959_c0_g1_i1::g.2850::m.2850
MEALLRKAASGEGAYHKTSSRVYNTAEGISESRSTEHDDILRREKVLMTRELGDQRVTLTKCRDLRTSREECHQDLHHVAPDGIEDFDRRWAQAHQRTIAASATASAVPYSHGSGGTRGTLVQR